MDWFNKVCNKISASFFKLIYALTSDINFWTTARGNLTQLSYMYLKNEPLGTEFKIVTILYYWGFSFLDINRVNGGMKDKKYHQDLGEILSFKKRIVE